MDLPPYCRRVEGREDGFASVCLLAAATACCIVNTRVCRAEQSPNCTVHESTLCGSIDGSIRHQAVRLKAGLSIALAVANQRLTEFSPKPPNDGRITVHAQA